MVIDRLKALQNEHGMRSVHVYADHGQSAEGCTSIDMELITEDDGNVEIIHEDDFDDFDEFENRTEIVFVMYGQEGETL
jgi:hypothetical protein